MRRRNVTIATAITGGVVALALAAGPSFAQAGSATPETGRGTCTSTATGDRTCTGTGTGDSANTARGRGNGTGNGDSASTARGRGNGSGNGNGQHAMTGRSSTSKAPGRRATGSTAVTATGTLTAAQKSALASMAEEEKVAHDVYVALAAQYPSLPQFTNIARSELQHMTAIRTLMTTYGITDPTLGLPEGTFASPDMQALYDSMLASATSSSAALAAGVAVEKADIADLTDALVGVTAPDVTRVYTQLRTASERHLAAFGG